MARFRKKPVEIEAIPAADFIEQVDGAEKNLPQWASTALKSQVVFSVTHFGLMIKTLEGDHYANPDDMIIRGVKGEIYPCKPDIFAMTYDAI